MREERLYQEDNAEMNIVDLFWSVLCHWRSLLVSILVLGIVMGGIGAAREYRDLTNEDVVRQRQEAYEGALETYRLEKDQLETRLQNLRTDLERQQFYKENDVMLLIDPHNVYIKSASYYVNTNYEIAPQMVFQNPNYTSVITLSYKAALDRLDLDAVIATDDMPDLTARNPINGEKKMISIDVDEANGVLNVTVYGDTPQRVERIFESVQETMENQEELLNKVIGEHTLGLLSEKDYTDIDAEFEALQIAFDTKTEEITNGIEETNESLDDLRGPVNATPTMKSVVKDGVKFGVIGAVIGLICLTIYYAVRFLVQDRLNNTEELCRRYELPVLGTLVKNTRGWLRLDKFMAGKLGINADRNAGDAAGYIASSIRFYLKDSKKLLLVGNCTQEQLQELRDELAPLLQGVELRVGGSVNESAAAMDALRSESNVVCVERWLETSHREIRHELQAVKSSGNPNLGFIVLR